MKRIIFDIVLIITVKFLMTAMDLSADKTDSQYEQLIPIVENVSQESQDFEGINSHTAK